MAKSRHLRSLGLTLALAAAQGTPLAAQSLLLEAPSAVSQPEAGASGTILSSRPAETTVEDVAKAAAPVPFEQAASSFRLEGEEATGRFTFNLAPEQAKAGGRLQIAYRNAVSVLPDNAVLDVLVNGAQAGSFPIASPNGFKPELLKLSPAMLKAGRNDVILKARQFHRVDCSVEATYELWTEFDPAATGFVPGTPRGFASADDLLTLARNASGATDIRLVLPASATAAMLNDAAPVLQTLALFLDRDDIAVTVATTPGEGPGMDLYVMTAATRTLLARAGNPMSQAPRGLSVRDGQEPGRAIVSLSSGTSEEISAQLLSAIKGPLKSGLDTGVFAETPGRIVASPGGRYMLGDAGFETSIFTGRLARTAVDLVMPSDFYPADYATIGLKLHAATSPGLDPTSQLVVRVNGKAVSSYPFRDADGQQFDGKLIELPLRAFRPGQNRIDILAELPMAADRACATMVRDDSRPRFILLKETAIEVPSLARIARLPDIGVLAGTAYPYTGTQRFNLFIERPDSQSVSASLTLLTRLALSARNPLNVEVKAGAPKGGDGRNALVVTSDQSFAELGPTAKADFPSPRFAIDDVASAALSSDPLTTAAISTAIPGMADETASPEALLDAFHRSTSTSEDNQSLPARLRAWFSSAGDRFVNWLSYGAGNNEGGQTASVDALLSLSQKRSPEGDATWTVVRSKTPRDLVLGVRRLTEPTVWQSLQGGSAEIASADMAVTNHAADSHFIAALDDRSPGNVRRVAAAWFSDNFQIYVLLIVVFMGIFAVWLGRRIPNKGVRS